MADPRRLLQHPLLRHPLLQHPRLRQPLTAALAAALLSQALLLLVLRVPAAPTGNGDRPRGAGANATGSSAATAELLQLSRSLERAAAAGGPAGNLLSLPLPPPPPPPPPLAELMPGPAAAGGTSGQPAGGSSAPPPGSRQNAAAPAETSQRAGLSAELPAQPAAALELARAVAGGAGSGLAADGATEALLAVQRRQWWMDPALLQQLQRTWTQARKASAPAGWRDLPPDLELRRLPLRQASALVALIGGDPQGRSLVARQQLTLLWRQGESLWLLRQPLGGGEGAGAARAGLTNS